MSNKKSLNNKTKQIIKKWNKNITSSSRVKLKLRLINKYKTGKLNIGAAEAIFFRK